MNQSLGYITSTRFFFALLTTLHIAHIEQENNVDDDFTEDVQLFIFLNCTLFLYIYIHGSLMIKMVNNIYGNNLHNHS